MCQKIDVLGLKLDYLNVETFIEKIDELMKNEKLSLVSIVTMRTLLLADADPVWKRFLQETDLTVIGEMEVLKAAGSADGQIAEEVRNDEFVARFFWYLIQHHNTVFVLGESEEEVEGLHNYLLETYPDITVAGSAVAKDADTDVAVINEINSMTVDVVVSGLQGNKQNRIAIDNRSSLSSKLWFCLGEHPEVQTEAGLKSSWWSTLLEKNAFKRLVAKYKSKNER